MSKLIQAQTEVPETKWIYASWGYQIKVMIIGQWGHDAYSEEYTFSGSHGKFPNYVYRFTRIGESSVAGDKFLDLEIKSENLIVGYKDFRYRILDITSRGV